MKPNLHIELIDNWRNFHKFWSIRLGALGSLITGIFIAWPDSLYDMFQNMPPVVQAMIAPKTLQYIGLFFFVMAMLSRVVKQRTIDLPEQTKGSTT
jgi:hypothetical protein